MKANLLSFGMMLSLSLAPLFTGCATKVLWNRQVQVPALPPTFATLPGSNDVLVRFQENTDRSKDKQPIPRAYWLMASTNVSEGRPPDFVDATNDLGWIDVPVADLTLPSVNAKRMEMKWVRENIGDPAPRSVIVGNNSSGQQLIVTNMPPGNIYHRRLSSSPLRYIAVTNVPPDHGYYGVTYDNHLTLWRDRSELGVFDLPTNRIRSEGTWWRVILTPFAAVGDVVMAVGLLIAQCNP